MFSDRCKDVNNNILEFYKNYKFISITFNECVRLTDSVRYFPFRLGENEYHASAFSTFDGKRYDDTFFFIIDQYMNDIDHFVGYSGHANDCFSQDIGIFYKDENRFLKFKLSI